MNDRRHGVKSNVKWTESDSRTMQSLSTKLDGLEKRIDLIQTEGQAGLSIRPEDIQKMSTKITAINALIDSIEVEINHLNSRLREIEALRFKHRFRE